jgi:hypothetical protein
MGVMSKTIRYDLLFVMVPLLIFEGVFGYLAIVGREPRWFLFMPVSLLTLFPTWGLQDLLQYGWNDRFLTILEIIAFDIVFLGIMAFSIIRSSAAGCVVVECASLASREQWNRKST